jgi:hypothetical protein
MFERLILTIVILMIALLPLQAKVGCKEKLAEVDQRIASPQMYANQRNAVQMFRDEAAEMCAQGNEATAMQTLSMIEMMLPPSQAQQKQIAAAREADELTKSRLTNDFLEGVWCSMTGEERVQLVFASDGTHQPCFPSAVTQGYGQCISPISKGDWLDGYERVKSVEQDHIVLGSRRSGGMVYKRGECKLYGR